MLTSAISMAFWAALALWPMVPVHAERACPGDAGDGSWCYSVPDNWIANTSLAIQLDGNIPSSGVIIAVHKVSQFPNGSINHEPIATWSPFPSDPLLVTWIVNQTIGSSMHAHFTVGSDPKVTTATHVIMDAEGNTGATTTFTVATGYATPTAGAANSNNDSGGGGGVSIGMVVGIVAAGVGVILLIAGVWLYHRRAVKRAAKKAKNEVRESEARFGPKYPSNDERPDYMSYDSYGSQYSGHGPTAQHMSSIQPYPTSLTHAALAVNASQHSGVGIRSQEPSDQLSDRTSHMPLPNNMNNIQYQHPQPISPGLSPPVSDPRYSSVSGASSANDHIAALTTSVTNSVLQQLASLHLANQRNTVASLGTVQEDGSSQGTGGQGMGARRPSSQALSPVIAPDEGSSQTVSSPPRSPIHPVARPPPPPPPPNDLSDPVPASVGGGVDSEKAGYPGMYVTNPNDNIESIQPSPSQSGSRLQAPTRAMSVTSVGTAPPLYRER